MKFFLRFMALLIASQSLAQDREASSEDDWKIYVELKVFAASTQKVNPLIDDLRDEAKVNDAATKLETMVESGEAELVGTIASQTIHRGNISAFQGEEVRYPIEFEMPHFIEGNIGHVASQEARQRDVAYPATTYDTRKVGLSLEVEASVSNDGKRFVLEVKPQRTWLLKWDEFENGRLANNDKIVVKQPRFASSESRSTLAMQNRERVLLGIHPVPGSPDKKEVMLLRAWSTPRRKP